MEMISKTHHGRCLLFCLVVCIYLPTGDVAVSSKNMFRHETKRVLVIPRKVIFEVDPRLYSFGMGCNLEWARFITLRDPVLRSLAKELSPAYLRLGGTLCDRMTFCEEEDICSVYENVTLTSKQWDEINSFVEEVGMDLVFGANVLHRTPDDTWDPSNFEQILDYSSARGYPLSFELGNEPDADKHKFNKTLSPEQNADSFKTMKDILQRKRLYRHSLLIGPDTERMIGKHGGREYLKRFLDLIGNTTDVTSSHFYSKNRPPTETVLEFSTDPATLDQFVEDVGKLRDVVRNHRPPDRQRIWIGESGMLLGKDCGKMTLCASYASGMVLLSMLGVAAKNNIEVFVRETLIYGNREVFSLQSEPNPDYWSAVLYKRLVGTKVLDIGTTSISSGSVPPTLRVYAHCTKTNRSAYGYQSGAVTVYAVNFDPDDEVQLMFDGMSVDQFLLTPSRTKNITSTYVALNGRELSAHRGVISDMPPRAVSSDPILPPWSMAFFVLKNADFNGCKVIT